MRYENASAQSLWSKTQLTFSHGLQDNTKNGFLLSRDYVYDADPSELTTLKRVKARRSLLLSIFYCQLETLEFLRNTKTIEF